MSYAREGNQLAYLFSHPAAWRPQLGTRTFLARSWLNPISTSPRKANAGTLGNRLRGSGGVPSAAFPGEEEKPFASDVVASVIEGARRLMDARW